MFTEIMMIGGLFWSATYILIIRRGFKEKTFGMPLVALCANISWEAIFAFYSPHDAPQLYINYIWFALDAVIVFQFLKYGKKEFPKFSKWQFFTVFTLGISVAVPMIIGINYEFEDKSGVYAAFGQNLMMSILFVSWLANRKGIDGQSIYIALFKMIGTGLSSLAFFTYRPIAQDSNLLQFLFVAIFVFDVIYTIGLYRKCKKIESPFKRF
ncbi:MAG: hypothetical protein HOK63_04635 [Thaumarchaeota archaeon]|jgi:hypothetical protein|nr:hypothetical protein [Nitrososphaerota archaeon]MBT5842291.1 hypothetical protein [Nitrososphaerota archaeon]MBT6468919.1 hypothetical protein [Nitrososphaerota archaeon]